VTFYKFKVYLRDYGKNILETAGNGVSADIDQILNVINKSTSIPQYHEAIFILINNFHELIKEQAAC